MANAKRRLRVLAEHGYYEVRPEDMDYIQWKLDHAAGMRIALSRFLDALDKDQVQLGRRGRRKLKELKEAGELFQNFHPNG